jgi:hypothetical protein
MMKIELAIISLMGAFGLATANPFDPRAPVGCMTCSPLPLAQPQCDITVVMLCLGTFAAESEPRNCD